MKTIASVLVPQAVSQTFSYLFPEGDMPKRGMLVKLKFRNKQTYGVVMDFEYVDSLDHLSFKPKYIEDIIHQYSLSENLLQFIDWVARYTLSPIGAVFKMVIPIPDALEYEDKRKSKTTKTFFLEDNIYKSVTLTEQQKKASQHLIEKKEKFNVTLLQGVTGSGKTEVYFEWIKALMKQGGQVLILLPEIALTAQWEDRFQKRFGFSPLIWHSDLTPKQRKLYWQKLNLGKASVLVAARSGLCLPFKNLKGIIIDEEHDGSFKQEDTVIYHARDMAVVRAKIENIPVILSSATPSLETLYNAQNGKYDWVKLTERYAEAKLPSVKIIDMKTSHIERGKWIAPELVEAMKGNLERKEQSLIFLNRKGYAPLTLCRGCGHRLQCPNCTSWLVEYKQRRQYLCHHCGFTSPLLKECPECHAEDKFAACGPGVERVYEEVQENFPDARISMVTSETMTNQKAAAEFVHSVERGDIDILIGTQILAKGYHFPNLTLIGVVDADAGLIGGDLRASEKTYQLLNQVSGRAGRESKPGFVYIQTWQDNNPVIGSLGQLESEKFFEQELKMRQQAAMPPFGKLAAVIVSGKKEDELKSVIRIMASQIPRDNAIRVLGPSPAPLYKLRKWYRYRFLIKAPKTVNPQGYIQSWLDPLKFPSHIKITTDIDPYSFS